MSFATKIGASRSNCTTRFLVTNQAFRCQNLKGMIGRNAAHGMSWSLATDLRCPHRDTKPGHRFLCVQGMIGAAGWICTSCLVLTKNAHICMCFDGELAANTGLEPVTSGLTVRFPHPAGLSAKLVGPRSIELRSRRLRGGTLATLS